MFNSAVPDTSPSVEVNGMLTFRCSETVLAFDYDSVVDTLDLHYFSPPMFLSNQKRT
jgi:hypothetical protein